MKKLFLLGILCLFVITKVHAQTGGYIGNFNISSGSVDPSLSVSIIGNTMVIAINVPSPTDDPDVNPYYNEVYLTLDSYADPGGQVAYIDDYSGTAGTYYLYYDISSITEPTEFDLGVFIHGDQYGIANFTYYPDYYD